MHHHSLQVFVITQSQSNLEGVNAQRLHLSTLVFQLQ